MTSTTWVATAFASCARHVLQQHDELVAAEARDEVLGAHGVTNLLSRELQQMIARRVTAGVVDVLELVEIDEEQRAPVLLLGGLSDLRVELREQPMPVVQARQRIVVRKMQQMALALLQCADRVVERGDDGLQLAVRRVREGHFRVAIGELHQGPLQLRQRR